MTNGKGEQMGKTSINFKWFFWFSKSTEWHIIDKFVVEIKRYFQYLSGQKYVWHELKLMLNPQLSQNYFESAGQTNRIFCFTVFLLHVPYKGL